MKMAIFAVLGLFISLSAHAETVTYSSNEQAEESCPVLQSASVNMQKGEGVTASLVFADGGKLKIANITHSSSCDSDIVCNGFDTGSQKLANGELAIVSFEHANDGQYPTSLFAFYKNVDVEIGARSCVYQIVTVR